MKIAVSGKGGVGKTTISSGLIRFLANRGYHVYAVDADADTSLGTVLGLPEELLEELKPIVDLRQVIADKTGGDGAFFSLNPDVEDILKQYSVRHGNISFLKMGAVKAGGSSCYCRENTVLNALVSSLVLKKEEVVVLDMGAGIEHLTRGTARGVDLMLIVVEPSKVSIQTAKVVQQLAGDLGVKQVKFLGNKIRSRKEQEFIQSNLPPSDIAGMVNFSDSIWESAMGTELFQEPQELTDSIAQIGDRIMREVGENAG
ncbi:MAG: ATP-binding protein [Bacillota bacterium]